MTTVLIICGPTSSGKTSLALSIAKKLGNTTIISADSRQVYCGVDIISGKDVPSNLPSGLDFFGIDLFDPDQIANLSDYVSLVRNKITQELQQNRNIIVVGGTGLYLKGLTEDLSDINIPIDQSLRDELDRLSISELQQKLKSLDINRFNKLNNSDANNPRRLVRHIEIALNKISPRQLPPIPKVSFYWIGLKVDLDKLPHTIRERVETRLRNGATNEVQNLLSKYPNQKLPIYTSLGISDILSYLNHQTSKEQLINDWTNHEVSYAKRQITWFKKQPSIIWYDESVDRQLLSHQLYEYLSNKNVQ